MNSLIIGGNGFIGSHLVDCLLQKGHQVRVFDMTYEHYRKPLNNVDYRISSLENVQDLYESLMDIDIVFHLASSSVPSSSNIDIIADINKNLIPTITILNMMVKLGIKKIVFFSSGGTVYGNPVKTPVAEDHPIKPISSYGIVKATIEKYLFLYQRLHGIRPLILRPSNPYGPRQGHFMAQGVISTFLQKIKMDEPLIVYGDGTTVKDYIYIEELVELCYKLLMNDANGEFNLASGREASVNNIIEYIKSVTGKSPKINYIDKQIYDVEGFVLDVAKLTDVIGPYNCISLEEGISRYWDWLNRINP